MSFCSFFMVDGFIHCQGRSTTPFKIKRLNLKLLNFRFQSSLTLVVDPSPDGGTKTD
jgi:hypothetical protein